MSPLVTIEVEGHPFRAPQTVTDFLGIPPGASVPAERFADLKRSCLAYNAVLKLVDDAHKALFPDPCGPPHYAPDPNCPECHGKGRNRIPASGLMDEAYRVENCKTCIQPYPRWPKPRLGA